MPLQGTCGKHTAGDTWLDRVCRAAYAVYYVAWQGMLGEHDPCIELLDRVC